MASRSIASSSASRNRGSRTAAVDAPPPSIGCAYVLKAIWVKPDAAPWTTSMSRGRLEAVDVGRRDTAGVVDLASRQGRGKRSRVPGRTGSRPRRRTGGCPSRRGSGRTAPRCRAASRRSGTARTPTTGGSRWKSVAAAANGTLDQMCSGRIGTSAPRSRVVGLAVVNVTVCGSTSCTDRRPAARVRTSP